MSGKRKVIEESDDDDIPLASLIIAKTALQEPAAQPALQSKVTALVESDSDDDKPLINLLAKKTEFKPATAASMSTKSSKSSSNSPLPSSLKSSVSRENSNSKAQAMSTVKAGLGNTALPKKIKSQPAEESMKKISKNFTAPTVIVAPELSKAQKKKLEKGNSKKSEDINDEEDYKWWDYIPEDQSVKWTSLSHHGVLFPLPYKPINVPIKYAGELIHLPAESEEIAGFFAALAGADHVANPIFVNNFWEDFRNSLKDDKKLFNKVKEFSKCDFTLMTEFFLKQREDKKLLTKEQKAQIKEEKSILEEKYMYCVLDGRKEKVGNFRIEPPGLFKGRGKHPKAGKLKTRVQPEQVTINIGADAAIPVPPAGHRWKEIIHDNTVTWLATWTENVNNNIKYVFLAANSSLKGLSDLKKFEKARELKDYIDRIRSTNATELKSTECATRQRATALWLIDHLALRAGNEKGDDEADTVGCCSLRVEHVTLTEPNTVTFDFLGKDSIRYLNSVPVDKVIFSNLEQFIGKFEDGKSKSQEDLIFDLLTTSTLNKYLTCLMPGLTAKVFRTFNASVTFQRELDQSEVPELLADKLLVYNRANRQVAILCNHQKAVPKMHSQTIGKMKDKVLTLKYQRHLYKIDLKRKLMEDKQKIPSELNEPESELDEETMKIKEIELKERDNEKEKEKAEKLKEKSTVASQDSVTSSPRKKTSSARDLSIEQLEKKIADISKRIAIAKTQLIDRDENKNTALSTSKVNYIDPRISVAWASQHQVPIEKLFNKSLKDKFKWAMSVPADWKF